MINSSITFTGCVGAELLLGQPLFPGDSGVDQLVEIIKVIYFVVDSLQLLRFFRLIIQLT